MSKSFLKNIFWIALVALILSFVPSLYSQGKDTYRILKSKMQVLNQIIQYINQYYFDSVEIDNLMDGAFKGMMKELDPHSIYIPAKKAGRYRRKISRYFPRHWYRIWYFRRIYYHYFPRSRWSLWTRRTSPWRSNNFHWR